MSWRQITTAALLLAGSANLGLTAEAQTLQNATFSDVLVQSEETTGEIEAKFTYDVPYGEAPLEVNFDASESVGRGLKYEWDFGDGSTANGEKVKHTFTQEGRIFDVTLTVSNQGQQDSHTNRITVTSRTYSETKTSVGGPEFSIALVPFYPNYSDIIFTDNVLPADTEVKMTATAENATTYPDTSSFKNVYDVDSVFPVGPLTTIEFPFSALDLSGEQRVLMYLSPIHDWETYGKDEVFTAEIRITKADGSEYFYPDYRAAGEPIEIRNTTLRTIFGDDLPETFKLSIQVVSLEGDPRGNGSGVEIAPQQ